VTSKRLNDGYKNPERIAHNVLAERIEKRTGRKLQVGDRIEFVQVYDPRVNN